MGAAKGSIYREIGEKCSILQFTEHALPNKFLCPSNEMILKSSV